ncbi:MAG: TetR/AcrR family transcriptional regulator [Muribaculaceae bacterium]|nr:TetR/AcrR family transcriptional regulator [Muribaculaceae bacterium]
MRTGGDATRKRLLTAALRLFTQKPYDKVTLKEIEHATGLSRGALMYHVPNKETLFREAVEMFVFGNNTLTALEDSDKESLKDAGEWYENECSLWREVIERAIASGEIRKVDSGLYAHVFENCYLGTAYAGLPLPGGYSPEMVGEQLLAIYSFLSLNVED